MPIVMWVAAAVAGILQVLFFCFESLWWTKPAVHRRFRSTEAQAQVTKSLAFNGDVPGAVEFEKRVAAAPW